MKTISLFFFVALTALAQSPVILSQGPPPVAFVQQPFYDGSGNLIYNCKAHAFRQSATVFGISVSTSGSPAVTQPLLTNVSVSSNVGTINFASTFYGWPKMQVTISGSTTAALNGTYTVSAVSGSTATITTSGVSDGTYNSAATVISTNQPMLNQPVWAILAQSFSGTQLVVSTWANGSVAEALACSSRANY